MGKDNRATPRQIVYLQERSIPHAPGITRAEASELITEYQATHDEADERHVLDLED